ncbi:MAG: MATE family efflux transporter, partial [Deltaproteobacteria bacterium]
ILSNVLQGAGYTHWVMKVEGVAVWLLFLPSTYILSTIFGFGLYGAWMSMLGYSIIFGTAMLWKFKTGKWKESEI